MIERVIKTVSVVACLLVVAGFGLFALDETRTASRQSQAEIAGQRATRSVDPSASQERARERAHGTVREAIDDSNDILLRPFAGIVASGADRWARRGVPAALALVVYGFGLGFLARYAKGSR